MPQVAPKDKGMRLGAMPAGSKRNTPPPRHPQGAVAPQVGSKEGGARLACGARRLKAEMSWLPPRQRLQGAVVPQVAPKDKGMRLGAMPAGLRGKMRHYSPLRRKRV